LGIEYPVPVSGPDQMSIGSVDKTKFGTKNHN